MRIAVHSFKAKPVFLQAEPIGPTRGEVELDNRVRDRQFIALRKYSVTIPWHWPTYRYSPVRSMSDSAEISGQYF